MLNYVVEGSSFVKYDKKRIDELLLLKKKQKNMQGDEFRCHR